MKKAILALTICAVIGNFTVTSNALAGPVIVHVADANGASNGLLLEGQENAAYNLDDIAKQSDFVADQDRQNQLISGNTTATKAAQNAADVARTIAGDNQNAIAGHESRLSAVEKESTLSALHIQGVQAAIVDHGDRLNGLQRQTDDEVTRAKAAESANFATANAANTAAGNAQHSADLAQNKAGDNETKINSHDTRIQTVENQTTLNGLHVQGLQTDIVAHGNRMNNLQNQTDKEVARAKAAESINTATAGDAKTLATSAQTTAIAASTTATQAKTQATTNGQRIDNHESRISVLEAINGNGSAFEDLKNKVDDNRKRASAGIAGVAAMANIPQVIQGQTFAVGAGVGTTDSESALAVGFSARATEHVVVKASVSDNTQQNFVVGAGASYGW